MADNVAMNRLYLDSAVIRAAHDDTDPHRAPADWLLAQVRQGALEVAVSELTWRELASDMASTLIAATFRDAGVPTLPAPTEGAGPDVHRGVMQAAGLDAILSFDPTYDTFDELTRVDPAALHAAEQSG